MMGLKDDGHERDRDRKLRWWRRAAARGLAAVLIAGALGAIGWRFKSRWFPGPLGRANALYSRGDYGAAARLARQRLKEAPGDVPALLLAARAAARLDRDQAAVTLYARAPAREMAAEDHYLNGRALSRAGRNDEALAAFEAARAIEPGHPDTLDFLCRLYYRLDRFYPAEKAAERLALHPDREAKARLMLGMVRAELADPAGTARALDRWWELDPKGLLAAPDTPITHQLLLVRSRLESGQPGRARSIIERLLASGPNPELSWLLGRVWIQEKDWDRASAALRDSSAAVRTDHAAFPEPAPFLGAARCAECHAEQAAAVRSSHHASTFFRARELKNLPWPHAAVADPGDPAVTHEFQHDGAKLNLTTRAGDRILRAVVDYAFGSPDHFTTFVGRDEKGRSRMFRMSAYRSEGGLKFDLATGLERRPANTEELLGRFLDEGDGIRRCLECHTTRFRAILDEAGPEAADHSIGCERCHGPGGHHLAAIKAGLADPAIGNPSKGTSATTNELCAHCHGFSETDKIAASPTSPALLRFQSVTLTFSRCYAESEGRLSCVTCHDPHRPVETATTINEGKCLACHAAPASGESPPAAPSAAARETGRKARSDRPVGKPCPVDATKGCLQCHMPRIWQEETHSFKTDHFIRVREKDKGPENGGRSAGAH